MEIQLNHRKPRDEIRQIAFVTISEINDQIYRFQVGDVPADLTNDEDVLEHLESRSEELHLFCLKKTYPGYDLSEFRTEENTELEAFLEWIEAGCKNRILIGHDEEKDEPIYKYEEIANHVFAGTHPLRYPPSSEDLNEALELINNFANTTFEDLSDRVEQDENFLREISLVLLALIRLVDSK